MRDPDEEITEGIISSFLIDPDDRMLNFPSAVLTMLKHKIYPIQLLAYIEDRMMDLHLKSFLIDKNEDEIEYEIERYSRLVGNAMFVSKMTEAFWRDYNFELTHPNYYHFENIEA